MNWQSLDLNLLQIFDAVYGAGSVSGAAAVLGVSQPAVSGGLARLRESIGDPLFVRTKNGVMPTARADAMAGPVREALSRMQRALTTDQPFEPKDAKTTFRITMVDVAESAMIGQLVAAQQAAAGLRIQFRSHSGYNRFLSDLYSGQTDAAIHFMQFEAPQVLAHPLFRIRLVCVGRRGWQDRNGRMTRKRFDNARFVALKQALRAPSNLERSLAARGCYRKIYCEVSGMWSIAAIVAETELVALMPRVMFQEVSDTFDLEELPMPYDIPDEVTYLLWHERTDDDPAQKWLRQVCIDVFDNHSEGATNPDRPLSGKADIPAAAR